MKKLILSLTLFVAMYVHGQTYNQTYIEYQDIPDANPVGATFIRTFIMAPQPNDLVSKLTLMLDINGGFNGDLYAYLVAPNGSFVTLMDQPGAGFTNPFGYGGAGFNITLSDDATDSIQYTPETDGAVVTGTYQAYDSLANFIGSPANGDWTLYIEDRGSGGVSQLADWTLSITTVPEAGTWTLLGLGLVGIYGLRVRRKAQS